MNRKKLVIYILLAVAVIMVVDFRFSSGPFNQFFEAFITESLAEVQDMESEFFRGDFSEESVKAVRADSIEFGNKEEIISSINQLKIKNNFGSIDVSTSAEKNLKADYKIKVHAENIEAAQNYLENLSIDYNIDNQTLVVDLLDNNVERPKSIRAVEIEYDLIVPRDLSLNLDNRFGKVSVVDIDGDLALKNKWGSTVLRQIEGPSDIEVSYGELEIDEMASALSLNTSYTDNRIKNLEAEADIISAYAFTSLENIESDLNIKSRYGGFEIENVRGSLNVDSDYTGLSLTDIEQIITADVTYGDIRLKNINNIKLKSSYADTTIENINNIDDYNLDIRAENAEIRGDFDLNINEEDNAKIILQQKDNAEKNITIKSRFGDVIFTK